MTDAILSASNLSVGFHGRKRRALLQGLTLTLSPDRLSCLIGRNGVGKSTLIRTLAGLQKPIAGTVSAAGEDLYRIPPEKRARLVSAVLSGGVHVGNLKAVQVVELEIGRAHV